MKIYFTKTFSVNNSVYRTSIPPKTRPKIRKRSNFDKIRSWGWNGVSGKPELAAKQIKIDFTWTSSTAFLARETLHSVTYRPKFPFRNSGWSFHVFPLITEVKTLTFQVQSPFRRANISEYSVVTQTKTKLALYLIFIRLVIRLNQITWQMSVVARLDRFSLITENVSSPHE